MSKALQDYTRISRYSQYIPSLNRRETWEEQCDRVFDTMHAKKYESINIKDTIEYKESKEAVMNKHVLGSQRALQFGGKAVLNKNARMYNCSATFLDRPLVFQECMWLLLCGVGCGFSAQRHHVDKLPKILPIDGNKDPLDFVVPDTIEGWADAIGVMVSSYFVENQPFPKYFNREVNFDFSEIRPKGSKLSYTGGKAPGHVPLKKSLDKIKKILDECAAVRDKLRPIDAYDIIMHFSDSVISGGIRRSATICVFSPDDDEMVNAKTGNWFIDNPQRGRSNNSALLLRGKTTKEEFTKIMESVKECGEPGFVWSDSTEIIFNPCVEIGLYPVDEETGESGWEFCNLCEINMKLMKTEDDFYTACKAAAYIGTLQAGYTDFDYLTSASKRIIEREALIGVSMTGMMDKPSIAFNPDILRKGAQIVKDSNLHMAKILGINPAARTTCVKPAGSTSCILGTSSGIHPHHSKRYLRRVQVVKNDKPYEFFKKYNPDASEPSVWSANGTDDVITFLCEVPEEALTKTDVDAVKLLEFVKLVQNNWVVPGRNEHLCVKPYLNHNVSNTINVKDDEWGVVTDFIYDNRDSFAGISLLPMAGDKIYRQAPFEKVMFPEELVKTYGSAAIFSSGLIIHALQAFGDLFDACDAIILGDKELDVSVINGCDISLQFDELKKQIEKKMFVERARKFARKYFDNDLTRMTYCLKDVNTHKTWMDLERSYVDVPWKEFKETENNVRLNETVACAGGACELTRF